MRTLAISDAAYKLIVTEEDSGAAYYQRHFEWPQGASGAKDWTTCISIRQDDLRSGDTKSFIAAGLRGAPSLPSADSRRESQTDGFVTQ
jgi:hypothetical protein